MKKAAEYFGRVVHCKKDKYDIYAGRPTLLGNPFALGPGVDRARAIRLFRYYAIARMDMDPLFQRAIRACRGKAVGCFCYPLPCHVDVILELAYQPLIGEHSCEAVLENGKLNFR